MVQVLDGFKKIQKIFKAASDEVMEGRCVTRVEAFENGGLASYQEEIAQNNQMPQLLSQPSSPRVSRPPLHTSRQQAQYGLSYIEYEAYTLSKTMHSKLPMHTVIVYRIGRELRAALCFAEQIMAWSSMESLESYARTIDRYARTPSTYRMIKEDGTFQSLYGMRQSSWPYLNKEGATERKKIDSGACMNCGVVLPWSLLTIDHQRPQRKGAPEDMNPAILKTLRALRMTNEGPKGPKGRELQRVIFDPALKVNRVFPRVNDARAEVTDVLQRYTLNALGVIFYTLIVHSGHCEVLGDSCMHGLLNLRPYCSTCNSARQQGKPKFPV